MFINNLTTLVFAFLLIIGVSQISSNTGDLSCLTPDAAAGLCIALAKCGHIKEMMDKKPLFNEDIDYLRNSQCGYKNNEVYVCCRNQDANTKKSETGEKTEGTRGGAAPNQGTCGEVILNRIHGGNQTKIDEFPWLALIEYKTSSGNSAGYNCGGSLIGDRYILTAAHCLVDLASQRTPSRVRLGEWDTSTDRDCERDVRGQEDCAPPHIDVEIDKIIVHEDYSSASGNSLHDIALIRLARSVTFTDFVQPICLPIKQSLKEKTFEGEAMDIAGWGRTENGTFSDKKLKAIVPVIHFRDCQAVYSKKNLHLQSSQLCAGTEGIDACRGDSGGPLIGLDTADKARPYYFIAGIISFGSNPCGVRGWPGVYTKVSDYISWIQKNIQS